MIHLQDQQQRLRSVSLISLQKDGILRSAYVLKMNINGTLVTIWQRDTGFIFTNDSYALLTSDGYMVRCNDQ